MLHFHRFFQNEEVEILKKLLKFQLKNNQKNHFARQIKNARTRNKKIYIFNFVGELCYNFTLYDEKQKQNFWIF